MPTGHCPPPLPPPPSGCRKNHPHPLARPNLMYAPPPLHLTQKKLACMFVESVSSFKSKSIQNLDIEKWQRPYLLSFLLVFYFIRPS